MTDIEIQIINRIREGDKTVFHELYNIYFNRLCAYANSYVDNVTIAEDLVQDLFFNLWEKGKDLDITSSFSSYIFRSIHNQCIQHLRHKKVVAGYENRQMMKIKEAEIMLHSSVDFTYDKISFNEIQKIIADTYNALPDKTKKIFALSRQNFQSNHEIADKMEINIKTVEYHISKALQIFREALKDFLVILIFLI